MTCNNSPYVDTEALSSKTACCETDRIVWNYKGKWLGDQPQQTLRFFSFEVVDYVCSVVSSKQLFLIPVRY